MPGVAQPGGGLDPAERLLDPLTKAFADGIARMARGPGSWSWRVIRPSIADRRPDVCCTPWGVTPIARSRAMCSAAP